METVKERPAVDERWYELGLALVAENFERPRLIDDDLRDRLKAVLRRTYSEHPGAVDRPA